jgi:ATP-binding cassette subfamily B protein/subfamily B ATP-binding cassette protein MsbA
MLGIGIESSWPLASAYLVDRVILDGELSLAQKASRIAWIGSALGVLSFINAGLTWLRSRLMQVYHLELGFTLRSQLFRQILHLPLSELAEMKTGGILTRLSGDVDNTTGLLQNGVLNPALAALRLLVALTIVFCLDYRIAMLVVVVLPPLLSLQLTRSRRIRWIWRSIGQDRQDVDGRVSEGLGGVRIVRGFRRERGEMLAYMVGLHTAMRKQLLATRLQRLASTGWELTVPVAQLVIVCFGGYLVAQKQTTMGALIALQAYTYRLLEPVLHIANSLSDTQRGLASMDRVHEMLDKPREKPDLPGAVEAPSVVHEIAFSRVGFAYRPGHEVIVDFDLRVTGGSVIALTGASGSGKTTLTDLVARFHDPNRGAIRVNGIDLRQIKLQSYRKLLGVVPQEVFLFDGSIRDNIAYGRPQATLEEIEGAAKRANAHEFIARLPEGYDSVIGERGVKLSGGQRQRLSIARAILANPQILILDEATSNLDSESEQLIQESMKELLRGRTTFVIAHRLSTVVHADLIVVLDRGHIAETGTHPELMRRKGLYFAMVERQQWDAALTSPWDPQLRSAKQAPRFHRIETHVEEVLDSDRASSR